MKKRTTKERVEDFINEIDWMFQVNNHNKKIIFMDKDEDTPDGDQFCGEIFYNEEYQIIEVKLWPIFETRTREEQRKILLHEMCHIINTDSKAALCHALEGKLTHTRRITEINEKATSVIENIIDRLLTDRLTYAKKAYEKYLK